MPSASRITSSSPASRAASHSARTAARWTAPNRANAFVSGSAGPVIGAWYWDGWAGPLRPIVVLGSNGMRTDELMNLPPGLPVPVDDGACDHLPGMAVPPLGLAATDGTVVRLDEPFDGRTVVFAYPRTGEPDKD